MKMLINTNEGKYVENLKKMARQGSLTKDLNPAVCFMTNPKSVLFIFSRTTLSPLKFVLFSISLFYLQ